MADVRLDTPELDAGSPLARGLLAWWPMRPSGGRTLFDLGPGRRNHGALVNAPSWSACESGPTLSFDGAGGPRVTLPRDPLMPTATPWTWAIRFRLDPGATLGDRDHHCLLSTASSYGLYLTVGLGRVAAYLGGLPGWTEGATGAVVAGRWHTAAVSWHPSAGYALSLDGEVAATNGTTAVDWDYSGFASGYHVGRRADGGGAVPGFAGQIAGLSLHNRALPPAEIRGLHALGPMALAAPPGPTAFDLAAGMGGGAPAIEGSASLTAPAPAASAAPVATASAALAATAPSASAVVITVASASLTATTPSASATPVAVASPASLGASAPSASALAITPATAATTAPDPAASAVAVATASASLDAPAPSASAILGGGTLSASAALAAPAPSADAVPVALASAALAAPAPSAEADAIARASASLAVVAPTASATAVALASASLAAGPPSASVELGSTTPQASASLAAPDPAASAVAVAVGGASLWASAPSASASAVVLASASLAAPDPAASAVPADGGGAGDAPSDLMGAVLAVLAADPGLAAESGSDPVPVFEGVDPRRNPATPYPYAVVVDVAGRSRSFTGRGDLSRDRYFDLHWLDEDSARAARLIERSKAALRSAALAGGLDTAEGRVKSLLPGSDRSHPNPRSAAGIGDAAVVVDAMVQLHFVQSGTLAVA